MKQQFLTVYMASIAAQLVHEGYQIEKVELSTQNPNYLVYKFNYTPEIKQALQRILAERRR